MKKILVVDNDKFIVEFMNDVLSERGHKVVTAEGGLAAVDILKTYTPDIIFIDLVMPNIDGKKLCKIIRAMPELKDVAIVILSAIAAEENINIKELKANACIAKGPFKEMTKHIVETVDELGLTPLSGLLGETIGVPGIYSRNITKELLSIKDHFQTILGKISEGVLEITSEGRIVYANSIALSIIEIPEEKLLGFHFIDLFADDDRHRVAELMKPSGDKPQITTEEFPLLLNGHQVTLQFPPIDGYATSLVIINDITERLQAEEELRESEERFRILFESSKDANYITTREGNIVEANPSLLDLFGYSGEEISDWKAKETYVNDDDRSRFRKEIEKNGSVKDLEVKLRKKDGREMDCLITATVRWSKDGSIIGYQGIIRDVTELKRSQ
ncbi:MAG: PAS domain S-box protein, partial [Deltaproteobacteria bacterium]|nr:PAS domain S-box protein [Deltaproteobacteria bacterium]